MGNADDNVFSDMLLGLDYLKKFLSILVEFLWKTLLRISLSFQATYTAHTKHDYIVGSHTQINTYITSLPIRI